MSLPLRNINKGLVSGGQKLSNYVGIQLLLKNFKENYHLSEIEATAWNVTLVL